MGTREAIWLALLDSARWERYYGVLAGRFQRLDAAVRSVLFFFALGSVTSFVAEMPDAVRVTCGLVVAVALAVDFVAKPGQRAATLVLIRDECGRLRLALGDLLRQHPGMDDSQAEAGSRRLELQPAQCHGEGSDALECQGQRGDYQGRLCRDGVHLCVLTETTHEQGLRYPPGVPRPAPPPPPPPPSRPPGR